MEFAVTKQWSRYGVAAVLLSSAAFPIAAQSGLGSIEGRVLDYAGVPVTGANVTATLVTPGRAGSQLRSLSGDNGAFVLSPVPPGGYAVCAEFPARQLLDPCAWGERTLHINVDPSQRVVAGVKLLKGVPLNVRIDDPSQILTAEEAMPGGGGLMIGVHAPNGLFHPVRPAGRDGQGRGFTILAPAETALRLALNNRKLAIEDAAGTPLAENTQSIPFRAQYSEARKDFRFVVRSARR